MRRYIRDGLYLAGILISLPWYLAISAVRLARERAS